MQSYIHVRDFLMEHSDLAIGIYHTLLGARFQTHVFEYASKLKPDLSNHNHPPRLVISDNLYDPEILIPVVIDQTNCSREQAIEALKIKNNDVVSAIMYIIHGNTEEESKTTMEYKDSSDSEEEAQVEEEVSVEEDFFI